MSIPGAVPASGDPLPRVTDGVRQLFQNGASQADLDALKALSFVTVSSSTLLSAERVLTAGSGITLTDGGAGSTLTIAASGGAVVVGNGLFAVNRNDTDQTGATSGAYNKIQFHTELIDSDGYFDNATNYRYTPTVAGTYLIALSVNTLTGTSGESCQAEIRKNGSTAVARSTYFGTSSLSEATWQVFNVIDFNGSTDYVEGYCWVPAAVTTIRGFTRATFMWGMRLA